MKFKNYFFKRGAKVVDKLMISQNQTKDDHSRLVKDIDDENNKVRKARELLLGRDIDGADYKIIKSESEHKAEILEAKLSEIIHNQNTFIDIEPVVNKAVTCLTMLDLICYQSANYEKRELTGSMCPEKFTFEDLQHRTAKMGDLHSFIYLINIELGKKKRRASDRNLCLPIMAPEAGLEPATL
jgi:site-specific DNA recombinase